MPASIFSLDVRQNVFTKEAFAALKPLMDQTNRFPRLKLILLQEAFAPAFAPADRPAVVQEAQSWMPETHFKTF
jgi:hypothetical protein